MCSTLHPAGNALAVIVTYDVDTCKFFFAADVTAVAIRIGDVVSSGGRGYRSVCAKRRQVCTECVSNLKPSKLKIAISGEQVGVERRRSAWNIPCFCCQQYEPGLVIPPELLPTTTKAFISTKVVMV